MKQSEEWKVLDVRKKEFEADVHVCFFFVVVVVVVFNSVLNCDWFV